EQAEERSRALENAQIVGSARIERGAFGLGRVDPEAASERVVRILSTRRKRARAPAGPSPSDLLREKSRALTRLLDLVEDLDVATKRVQEGQALGERQDREPERGARRREKTRERGDETGEAKGRVLPRGSLEGGELTDDGFELVRDRLEIRDGFVHGPRRCENADFTRARRAMHERCAIGHRSVAALESSREPDCDSAPMLAPFRNQEGWRVRLMIASSVLSRL